MSPFCFALSTEFPPTCSAEPSRCTAVPSKAAGRPWQLSLAPGPAPGAEPSSAKSVTSAAEGHIFQHKCQPGWQLKWGQIFTASAADNTTGSAVSVCQTLNKISSVQEQVLPFSFSFPLYLLCSLHCSVPAVVPFPLRYNLVRLGRPELGGTERGEGQKKIKPQILFSISWSLPASVVPQGTSWNVNLCVWC